MDILWCLAVTILLFVVAALFVDILVRRQERRARMIAENDEYIDMMIAALFSFDFTTDNIVARRIDASTIRVGITQGRMMVEGTIKASSIGIWDMRNEH